MMRIGEAERPIAGNDDTVTEAAIVDAKSGYCGNIGINVRYVLCRRVGRGIATAGKYCSACIDARCIGPALITREGHYERRRCYQCFL